MKLNLFIVFLFAGALALILNAFDPAGNLFFDTAARSDFKTFWLSSQLAARGGNPYNHSELCKFQAEFLGSGLSCLQMVAPPWSLLPLVPLTYLQLTHAYILWVLLSLIIIVLVISRFLLKSPAQKEQFPVVTLLAFIFPPVFVTFLSGHFGAILLMVSLLAVEFIYKKRLYLAGVLLFFLTIKAHLFTALGGAALLASIRLKTLKLLIGSAIGAAVLSVACVSFLPDSIENWLHAGGNTQSLLNNRSETLVSEARLLLWALSGELPSWPLVAFSILGVLGGVLAGDRLFESSSAIKFYTVVIGISLLFAPYGWLYDNILLLPVYCALCLSMLLGRGSERRSAILLLIVLLSPLLLPLSNEEYLHLTSMYAALLLLVGASSRWEEL